MVTIIHKTIPEEFYQRITAMAKLGYKSPRVEIIPFLEKLQGISAITSGILRERACASREKVKGMLNPEEIEWAINEGRP